MQTSSISIKFNYSSLAASALLALVLVLLNASSTGFTRNGGDEEGSGIGGTGRMLLPGSESGLGGTGLRPFVGLNDVNEIEVLAPTSNRSLAIVSTLDIASEWQETPVTPPVSSPARVSASASKTLDSSAINISEQIQRDIDINAIAYRQSQQAQIPQRSSSMSNSTRDMAPVNIAPVNNEPGYIKQAITQQAVSRSQTKASTPVALDPAVAASEPATAAVGIDAVREVPAEPESLSWNAVASYLAPPGNAASFPEQLAVRSDENEFEEQMQLDSDTARLARPEHVQRPQLPTVQRVRPIQRAAILPPRIKPFRL